LKKIQEAIFFIAQRRFAKNKSWHLHFVDENLPKLGVAPRIFACHGAAGGLVNKMLGKFKIFRRNLSIEFAETFFLSFLRFQNTTMHCRLRHTGLYTSAEQK
jgi:hypothetical protein